MFRAVLLVLLLSGCSLLGDYEPALRLVTDRDAYHLDTALQIEVAVKNVSSSVVYFSTCMPTSLEELDGGRETASLGFLACQCICRAALDPGEEWTHDVPISWIKQHEDRFHRDEDATYRLRLIFYSDKRMSKPLGDASLLTNRFRLRD